MYPDYRVSTAPAPAGGESFANSQVGLSLETGPRVTRSEKRAYLEARIWRREKFSSGGNSQKWPKWQGFPRCKLNKIEQLRLTGGE